jgi:hypothetical protein
MSPNWGGPTTVSNSSFVDLALYTLVHLHLYVTMTIQILCTTSLSTYSIRLLIDIPKWERALPGQGPGSSANVLLRIGIHDADRRDAALVNGSRLSGELTSAADCDICGTARGYARQYELVAGGRGTGRRRRKVDAQGDACGEYCAAVGESLGNKLVDEGAVDVGGLGGARGCV